jgi:hypothetical protein
MLDDILEEDQLNIIDLHSSGIDHMIDINYPHRRLMQTSHYHMNDDDM